MHGGPGSGDFGHPGRPGEVGGSGGAEARATKEPAASKAASKRPLPIAPAPLGKKVDGRVSTLLKAVIRTDAAPKMSELIKDERAGKIDLRATAMKSNGPAITEIAKKSGVAEDTVRSLMKTWLTQNTLDGTVISLHEAVAEEFGHPLSPHLQRAAANLDRGFSPDGSVKLVGAQTLAEATERKHSRDDERAVVRAMYDHTQAKMAELGFKPGDSVTLYRGVRGKEGVAANTDVSVSSSPAESWAFHSEVAGYFANPKNWTEFGTKIPTHPHGAVLAASVPVSSLLAVPGTGFGDVSVGEVSVLGGGGKAKAVKVW